MTTLPPNYLRLSSKWLETNPLPEDGLLLEADDTWKPSSQRGRITATPGFDYATARTDLPKEAYLEESEPAPDLTQPGLPKAGLTQPLSEIGQEQWECVPDSEPGAEVASERAEETETTPCLICGKPVEGYVAEYCCSGHECGCMGAPMEPCTCSKECDAALFENIGMPMEERRIKAGIAKWDELATLRAEIAELKAARDEANESVTLNYNTILELRQIITETKAELDICRSALGIQIHEKIPEQTPTFGSILVDSVGSRRRIAPAAENEEKIANELATLRAQLDAKEAEVEHRAKQRDEFQNLFIEASDGFNRRGEQLARLTAELDAVRKENDWRTTTLKNREETLSKVSNDVVIARTERDAAQARCGALERAFVALLERPRPIQISAAELAQFKALLTPSQQPDNLDSSGGESRTAIAGADGSKHTKGDCNPQGSESRKANPKIASESSASPAVNPSRPEPVKAGEWLPMETAPKRKVLLRIQTSPDAFRTVEALWINGQWDFDGMLFFKPVGWKPTAPEWKATEGEG